MNHVPSDALRVPATALRDLVRALAERAGAGEVQATLLSELLVSNDLRGVFSHGSRQIADYARLLRDGKLNPRPQVRILNESAATLLLDGDAGLGYFPCWEAAHRLVHGGVDTPRVSRTKSLPSCRKNYRATSASLY